MAALSRAKAWLPILDPADIAIGYPSLKEDGTPFEQEDFAACVKEIRPLASQLSVETDLSRYQAAYTVENSKVRAPAYDVVDLISPMRKHTFAPEIDPSELIDDEAEF